MVSTRYNRPEEKAEREAGNLEVDLEDIDDREMRSRRRSAPGKLYKSDARFVEKQKLLVSPDLTLLQEQLFEDCCC